MSMRRKLRRGSVWVDHSMVCRQGSLEHIRSTLGDASGKAARSRATLDSPCARWSRRSGARPG